MGGGWGWFYRGGFTGDKWQGRGATRTPPTPSIAPQHRIVACYRWGCKALIPKILRGEGTQTLNLTNFTVQLTRMLTTRIFSYDEPSTYEYRYTCVVILNPGVNTWNYSTIDKNSTTIIVPYCNNNNFTILLLLFL